MSFAIVKIVVPLEIGMKFAPLAVVWSEKVVLVLEMRMKKNLKLKIEKQIDFRVTDGDVSGRKNGDIIKGYLLKTDHYNGYLVYLPKDKKNHDLWGCVMVCEYHPLSDTFSSTKAGLWFNFEEE